MSSCGNPAVEGDALMQKRSKFDKSRDCVKCKENSGNIVVRHAVYCKSCFAPMISHKFRRGVEAYVNCEPKNSRRRTLKASGNVLLGFSGGVGSSVLLDLVHQTYFSPRDTDAGGKEHPRHDPIWQKGTVCYVDISGAFPGMRDRTEDIRSVVSSYESLDFVVVRLENAFDDAWWQFVGGKPSSSDLKIDISHEDLLISRISNQSSSIEEPISALRSFISSLPTQTAISRAIPTLVRLLLLYTARRTGCSHLLLGTSLTSMSISLISSISQGAGFVLREEADEEWSTTGLSAPIRVVRPLRDVGMKECTAWAWWHRLKVIQKERIPGSVQDIAALTKEFIVGLEKDYPSTVSTIARTCGKLAPKHGSLRSCLFCERPIQEGIEDWLSRTSIRSLSATQDVPVSASYPPHLTPYLCYACHTTLTSRSSRGATHSGEATVRLPVWVTSGLSTALDLDTAKSTRIEPNGALATEDGITSSEVWRTRNVGEAEMKKSIGDFLLDDEAS